MRLILLALIAVVFPVLAQQSDFSAKDWLKHMSHALQEKQFKTSLIHLQADRISPLVYLHGRVNGKDVAFLEYLNGPPKNAVRIDNSVTFIEHDQPSYSVAASRIEGGWPNMLAGNFNDFEQGYEFVLGGRSRIAGRPGQMIRMISRDDSAYSHQIWVDMDTYLPLRYDLLNAEKQLIEQVMAVEILPLQDTPPLLSEIVAQKWPPVIKSTGLAKGQNWQFSWLPKGFKVTSRDKHQLIGNQKAVEYIAITDGVVNVSVYVSRIGDAPLPEEVVTRNGLSLVSETLGNAEVVVVGKAPIETLRKIASGLKLG